MSQCHKIFIAVACLLLATCTKIQNTATQELDTAGDEASASYNKVRNILDVPRKPPKPPADRAQPRYCYKTYEDVICYARPIPGEEERLVGYQTSSGKTGYTMSPPRVKQDKSTDDTTLGKSVAISPLPVPKDDKAKDDKQLKEIIFDPSELEPKELVPDKMQ